MDSEYYEFMILGWAWGHSVGEFVAYENEAPTNNQEYCLIHGSHDFRTRKTNFVLVHALDGTRVRTGSKFLGWHIEDDLAFRERASQTDYATRAIPLILFRTKRTPFPYCQYNTQPTVRSNISSA